MMSKQTVYNVVMVKVSELKNAPYNPRIRTDRKNLKNLRDGVIQAGGILVPIMVTKDLEIIDGHRRVAVAAELGIDEVPAFIMDKHNKEEIWGWTNGGLRPMSPPEMMQAYHKGYPISLIPLHVRANIKRLEKICDSDLFASLCERGASPTMISNASRIAHYCDDVSDEFYRNIIIWYETHHQQYSSRRYMDSFQSPKVLHDAIINNRPLVVRWE